MLYIIRDPVSMA